MAFKQVFSKFILTFIFLSLWAASACLIVVGAVVWHGAGNIDSIAKSTYALFPTVVLIGSGIFLFLLGVIGCFACINENRCLLSTFFILLLLILLGEITAATMGIVFNGQLQTSINNELHTEIRSYGNDSMLRSEIDLIQSTYKCCGISNYTDWLETQWSRDNNSTVPSTCCMDKKCGGPDPTVDPRVFQVGCLSKLVGDFKHYLGLIAAFGLVVAILQVMGLLASCLLMCRDRQRQGYQLFGSPQGGHHV